MKLNKPYRLNFSPLFRFFIISARPIKKRHTTVAHIPHLQSLTPVRGVLQNPYCKTEWHYRTL